MINLRNNIDIYFNELYGNVLTKFADDILRFSRYFWLYKLVRPSEIPLSRSIRRYCRLRDNPDKNWNLMWLKNSRPFVCSIILWYVFFVMTMPRENYVIKMYDFCFPWRIHVIRMFNRLRFSMHEINNIHCLRVKIPE